MKKYYEKFNGIKKTGGKCKVNDCKKDLIITDLALSTGEEICQQCFINRQQRNKINKQNEK